MYLEYRRYNKYSISQRYYHAYRARGTRENTYITLYKLYYCIKLI